MGYPTRVAAARTGADACRVRDGRNHRPTDPVTEREHLGTIRDLGMNPRRRHPVDVAVVLGVIAELVTGVDDPAADGGIGAQPSADRQDRDLCAAGGDLVEKPTDRWRVALAVERQRDSAAVPWSMAHFVRKSRKTGLYPLVRVTARRVRRRRPHGRCGPVGGRAAAAEGRDTQRGDSAESSTTIHPADARPQSLKAS